MKKIISSLLRIGPAVVALGAGTRAYALSTDWKDWVPGTSFSSHSLPDLVKSAIGLLLAFGGVIALIYLIVAGYQYITAGGNAEQATAARTAILNAIIGIVVIFASYVIMNYIFDHYLS